MTTPLQRHVPGTILVTHKISIPIQLTQKELMPTYRRLAATPSTDSTIDAATAQKAMDAFAKAIGQPAGTDPDTLDPLWDQCIEALGGAPDSSATPMSPTDDATTRRSMTAKEIEMCRQKGVSLAAYAKTRDGIRKASQR